MPASETVTNPPTPALTTGGRRLPRLADVPAFSEYMAQRWGTPDRTPPVVAGAAGAASRHRARLSAEFPGQTLIIGAGTAPVRSNDTYYDFRPDSDFYWLTGASIEAAVLVMAPSGTSHDATLYIPAPFYAGDPQFFANAAHGEMWVGSAPDFSDWSQALSLQVLPLTELDAGIAAAMRAGVGTLGTGKIAADLSSRFGLPAGGELGRVMATLRMVKDDWEIAQLREAVGHTIDGFAAVVREIPQAVRGGGERWLQGTFDRHARTYGNGVGYATIVGSGKHAPTLHWVRSDGPVLEDRVLLLDMGVEANSFYTADVTRSFPGGGTFSPIQRQVHDLVEKSHRAGLAAVGPGRPWTDFHHASMEVIANGLFDWGLLPVSVDEALSPAGQHHRRYLVCGVGHHLGLDVHDCGQSSHEDYQAATMAPGMVLAVEPGLYFHEHDLTLPPELRGIGVRLEDNVLITDTGSEVISDALPITATGIEDWVAQVQQG
ncbi:MULTISPECIES: aminopeptidase P family protein [Arthrobacter]|uniref:aminopeptidase P family protein n=1 Tax=Arthrobacter TaxID=1663 RepID=UPI000535B249|nr:MULTISPECIES: aminopeptidase P family protein [Arthrobacter]AIY03950.1 putative Xaa-Pro aminopeptidase I [Arthrobacter sp. PAMC 25486]